MSVFRVLTLFLVVAVSGCTSLGSIDPAERIIGQWQSDLAGFTLLTSYTDSEVVMGGQDPHPYVLEGDLLIIGDDRTTARKLAFPGRNEMTQTDVITGTVHSYTRVNN